MCEKTDRRCFLARGVLGSAGIGAAYGSLEKNTLLAAMQDGTVQPSGKKKPATDIPPGSLPCGKIGGVSISRLIIGGNLIGGWSHARDLMYTDKLFKSYNTEAKIFETLELAQECGINAIQIDASAWDTVLKYSKHRTAKLQVIANPGLTANKTEMKEKIKRLVDLGATLLYPHGGATDAHFMNGGKIDVLGQAVDLIKAQGVPAGVGCHSLDVVVASEKNNINPDFYVKTFHLDRYWSATPKNRRKEFDWMQMHADDHDANSDNMWCNNPKETAAFMETVEKPWIAFKVMAAGAIPPRTAFPYAFRHGADFVLAGMFDFQVETDVKIAIESLQKVQSRKRLWRG
jgi:hypothetical protein